MKSYLFDNREPDQVKIDFEIGVKNETVALEAIKKYFQLNPNRHRFTLLSYEKIAKDFFYKDGIGRYYKPDYKTLFRLEKSDPEKKKFNQISSFFYAELKTTPYILKCPIHIKKAQLDYLQRRYNQTAIAIISDPLKFAIKSVKDFIGYSEIKVIEKIGGKECYVLPFNYLNWICYGFPVNFFRKPKLSTED